MAPAAVRAWKQIMVLLQKQQPQSQQTQSEQTDSPAARKLSHEINVLLAELERTQSIPRAAWKTIIKDMEVPRQLAAQCCQRQLSSSGPSWWQAWTLLHILLQAAAHDIIQGRDMRVQDDSTVLEQCIRQQLQQANIFEHCTQMLLEAAQLLQAEGNTAAAAAPATQNPSAQGDGSSSGAHSSGSPSTMGGSSNISYTCLTALRLGSALMPLQEISSEGWCRIVEATAALAVAAVCFLDAVTRGAGPGDLLDPRVPEHTARVLFSVMRILQFTDSRQLLQSSAVNRAVTIAAMVVHAQSLLPLKVQQRPAVDTSSTTSGSGRAGGVGARGLLDSLVHLQLPEGSASRRQALRVWKAAQRLEAPLQQPLQQTVGISMQTVGWVAGNIPGSSQALDVTAEAVAVLSQHSWVFKQLGVDPQQTVFLIEEVEWIMELEVLPALLEQLPHQMLLVQLLLVALQRRYEQQQAGAAAAAWVASCRSVVLAAYQAIACSWHDWDLQLEAYAETSPELAAVARRLGGQEVRLILGGWMAAAMPIVLKILTGLLQEAEAVPAAAAAGAAAATPPAAAMASNLGSSGSSSSTSREVTAALQDCVLLLTFMGQQEIEGPPEVPKNAAGSSADNTGFLQAWVEHSAAISTALEGVWRAHVRLGACGGDEGDASAWGLGHSIQLPNILGGGGALLLAVKQAGPGSNEQRQLFSMLCSLWKLCRTLSMGGVQNADECVWKVVQPTAIMMLGDSGSDQQQQPAAGGAAATAEAAAVAAAATSSQQQSGAEGRIPWLVLLGRCLLHHAEQLLQLQQHTPNFGEQLQALVGGVLPPAGLVSAGMHAWHAATFLYDGFTWSGLLEGCKQGLTQGEGVGSLAAAGYPIHSAVQHANTAITALYALTVAGDAAASAAVYTAFAQELQALGGVLSTLPVPQACNNPGCTNMLGPTELAAVSGRSCICGGCLVARYCGRACQRATWQQHKPVCKALAAAAAAAAAGKQAVQC